MDINFLLEKFNLYLQDYDKRIRHIRLKKNHTLRVIQNSVKFADELKLDKDGKDLAYIIGLFHDLARFPQWQKYQTFNDQKSFDHGLYAVEWLNKTGYKFF